MKTLKTVLILGAGSDIAKAIARNISSHGLAVQLAGRRQEQLERLKKDLISRYGNDVTVHRFDATDFNSHANFVNALPVNPDIVIYSAGAMSDQKDALHDWELSRNMIEVNYSGAVSVLNYFAEIFEKNQNGVIIGISSVAGDRGRGSNYIYGSTKAAFTAYLSGLRNALSKNNVQVITVKPGFVYTKMTQHLNLPVKLTVHPDKVAEKVYIAIAKRKDIIYVKSLWRWIMQIIKLIPEPIFKRANL